MGRLVEAETPCFRCGYSLRGLSVEGECPECGSAVELSLRGDLLVHAAPEYVATLKRGSGLLLWSPLFLVGAAVLGAVVSEVVKPGRGADFISNALLSLVIGVFALGWWMLCTPDYGQSTGTRLRLLTRASAVAVAVVSGGSAVSRPLLAGLPMVEGGLRIVGLATFGMCLICGVNYVRRLCRRLPDERLGGSAANLSSVVWVSCCAVVVGDALGWVPVAGLPGVGLKVTVRFIEVIGSIMALIGFVYYCVVMSRFRDRLDGVAAAQGGIGSSR